MEYKYIHLIFAHDTKFVGRLLEMFYDQEANFNPNEMLFVTFYEQVYEGLSKFPNVVLDTSNKNPYIKYHNKCKWIFSHGAPSKKTLILTPRKVYKNIIYRYWGGSRTTHLNPSMKHPVKFFSEKVKILAFKYVMNSYAAIGIGNIVDYLDLTRIIDKDLKFYILDYPQRECYDYIYSVREKLDSKKKKEECVNIMLGHRGKVEGNHINILKKLAKYKDYKMKVYIPLSYGDKNYIENVIDFVKREKLDYVEIVTDFMPLEEYAEFLSTMDIGIFDGFTSYALGNISIMVLFSKTIYLDSNGIIAEAFSHDNIPFRKIQDLDNLSFEDFSNKLDYHVDYSDSSIVFRDYNGCVNAWKEVISDYS